MVRLGKINDLKVVKEVDFGIYLDGENYGEILMPKRYVPAGTKPGDTIECFIYFDSEDRIIATTEKPKAIVDEFACLKVISVNRVGAFLDWGLSKDLLVPYNEQAKKMEAGNWYVVYVFIDDETGLIVASAIVEDFLHGDIKNYKEGQEVDLLVYSQSELGYKAIINSSLSGMLYSNEVFRKIKIGDELKGYIKKIREDGKIDLALTRQGFKRVRDASTQIVEKLKENNGFLALGDKSPAEEIYNTFGLSKKAFKMAIGGLYKAKVIRIEENGIRLLKK